MHFYFKTSNTPLWLIKFLHMSHVTLFRKKCFESFCFLVQLDPTLLNWLYILNLFDKVTLTLCSNPNTEANLKQNCKSWNIIFAYLSWKKCPRNARLHGGHWYTERLLTWGDGVSLTCKHIAGRFARVTRLYTSGSTAGRETGDRRVATQCLVISRLPGYLQLCAKYARSDMLVFIFMSFGRF